METSIEELKEIHINYKAKSLAEEKERNLAICTLRYKEGLSLQAIGTRHGLSRQRVFQIINKTLK